MNYFLVNKENLNAVSLAKKLSREVVPGELIMVSPLEMDAFKNGDVLPVSIPEETKVVYLSEPKPLIVN